MSLYDIAVWWFQALGYVLGWLVCLCLYGMMRDYLRKNSPFR